MGLRPRVIVDRFEMVICSSTVSHLGFQSNWFGANVATKEDSKEIYE